MSHFLSQILFQGTSAQALDQISQIYDDQGFCVVSYLYGATIIKHHLFDYKNGDIPTSWQSALCTSSLILPDGAALRTWRRVAHSWGVVSGIPMLHNLNGTDFFPLLLEYYLAQGPVNIVCFGTYGGNLPTVSGEVIGSAGEWLQQQYGIGWTYWQDIEYHDTTTQRNWDAMHQACNPAYPTIMMVCLGSPRQEIRSSQHQSYFKQYRMIVCNQGATIDYWAGREIRAPWVIRVLWLESLWRLISDPRKNWSKFWISFMVVWKIITLSCDELMKKMGLK